MTTWARSDEQTTRDELDELFPCRARRRLTTLTDVAFTSVQQVGPRRWSTVSRCGDDVADWLQASLESDPWVVRAEPGEAVAGAGELLSTQAKARAGLATSRRPEPRARAAGGRR